MSHSKCASCGNGAFRVVSVGMSDSHHVLGVVQCAACDVPIGVVDGLDTQTKLLGEQRKLHQGLESRLANLEETLAHVLNLLRYES